MAQIQDRFNASRKVSVDATGALLIKGSGAGGSVNVISGSGDEAMIIDDTSTANVTYVCSAPIASSSADADWKIKKIDESTGVTIITFADGNSNYDNVADNRATTVVYS